MGDVPAERPLVIIGTGLIGSSIGMAWRRSNPTVEVKGYDPNAASLRIAHQMGAIDVPASSLEEAVSDRALVVLAPPTDAIGPVLQRLAPMAHPDSFVTDVGSTKTAIVRAGVESWGPRFVGGHPMAGSERSGPRAAQGTLFEGATWVLTPTEETDPTAFETVRRFAASLGAAPVAVPPARHDALVARLSHLPQLTASALVSLAIRSGDEEALLGLAAGGFRDVTRIAASDPDLWVGILRSNRSSILRALTEMGQLFKDLEVRLQGEDWPGLRSFLAEAQQARISLFQKPSHGGAPTTLTMLIPDRPGVLAEVTTAAGELGANIEDLALFHSPEGGQGRLELVISGGSGAAALEARLTGLGYEVEEGLPT